MPSEDYQKPPTLEDLAAAVPMPGLALAEALARLSDAELDNALDALYWARDSAGDEEC